MRLTVLLGALLCVLLQPADARPRSVAGNFPSTGCADPIMHPCAVTASTVRNFRTVQRIEKTRRFVQLPANPVIKRMGKDLSRVLAEGAGRIVSHPSGCPRRAFCGCGAAVRIFGKPIRSLWLAAEWLRRFPRAQAARGMAAVRRDGHHIVVLEEHIRGALWRVYDANSGRHRTRVHLRSIAGWTIVDPRAGA